jgi:glucosamine--fructose-6-phosphate aminotransferase (isomerizing)
MESLMPPRSVTLREILKQPRVWKQTIDQYNKQPAIAETLGDLDLIDEVVFTGCGSSVLLGESIAYWWQSLTEVPSHAVPASELLYHLESHMATDLGTLVVALSRSGTTELTLAAMKTAMAETPGRSVGVTCTPESVLARRADRSIELRWAADRSAAPSVSLTSMMVLLTYAAAVIGDRRDLTDDLALLPQATKQMIEGHGEAIQKLAATGEIGRLDVLGSGPQQGIAREAALKFKQMTGLPAEGLLPLEYLRGHRHCADEHALIVLLAPAETPPYEQQLLDVLSQELGLRVLRIGWMAGKKHPKVTTADGITHWPILGVESDLAGGLQSLVMLQLLACHMALARKRNPDTLSLPAAMEKFRLTAGRRRAH